jgi:hypothetical protein
MASAIDARNRARAVARLSIDLQEARERYRHLGRAVMHAVIRLLDGPELESCRNADAPFRRCAVPRLRGCADTHFRLEMKMVS